MPDPENLGSFFRQYKDLLKSYFETRMAIFRLSAIRKLSTSAGLFIWVLISLFLVFLITLFGGLVAGLWFSSLMHSYIRGFGLVTLILLLVFALLAAFRKPLFVHPVIRVIINHFSEEIREESDENAED